MNLNAKKKPKKAKIGSLFESQPQRCKTCGGSQFYVFMRRGKITVACCRCRISTEYAFDKSSAVLSDAFIWR